MISASLALRAVRALGGAGLLRPASPARTRDMIAALRRYGSSPAALCAVNAARSPDAVALIDDRGTVTWSQLDAQAAAIAGVLAHEHGVGPRRGLAVMCRNHRGFVQALNAGARLGADVLLLNTEFPAPQLGQALGSRELGAVILDGEFCGRFDDAGCSTPQLVAWSEDDGTGPLDATAAGPAKRVPAPSRASNITLLTSGTTGAPKGAGRDPSPDALVGPLVTMLEHLRPRRGEPLLIGPPLFHGFGLSFLMLGKLLGGPIVLHRRFDAARVLQSIAEQRVGWFVGVPVMLQRMLDVPDPPPVPSLRSVVAAGAPLPPHLSTAFMDAFGDMVFNAYGSTETGFASIAGPRDLRAAPGTVGRAPLGTSLRVLDDERRPVPAGQPGHIFVGGELVFDGYDGGGSKEIVDGHMNTGDLGHMDAAGRLFVDGREDDMIVSGGENVFPQEVEDTLAEHPAVADVTVVGVDDEEFGQRLKAFVVPEGQAPEADELLAHVRAALARYKTPREIVFVEAIPRNATGKVLRRELPR